MKKFIREWFAKATKRKSASGKKRTERSILPEIIGCLIIALIIACIPSLHSKDSYLWLKIPGGIVLVGFIAAIITGIIKNKEKFGFVANWTSSIFGWIKAGALLGIIILAFVALAALGAYLNGTGAGGTRERQAALRAQQPPLHYAVCYHVYAKAPPLTRRADIVRNDDRIFEAWMQSIHDKGLDGNPEKTHYWIDKSTGHGEWRSTAGRGGFMVVDSTDSGLRSESTNPDETLIIAGRMNDDPRDPDAKMIRFEFIRVD